MTTSPHSYEIDFMFALADFYLSEDADGPVRDMVTLSFIVLPDDTWRFTVGRSASLGPDIDATLHTLKGDATTSASDLLRMLAKRIMAPHEMPLSSMEQPS